MSDAKPTPGPWEAVKVHAALGSEVQVKGGHYATELYTVAHLNTLNAQYPQGPDDVRTATVEANARLIASAPTLLAQRDALLEAAERVLAEWDAERVTWTNWPYDPDHDRDDPGGFGRLRAAIAQAKEEQP